MILRSARRVATTETMQLPASRHLATETAVARAPVRKAKEKAQNSKN
jgi:DNA-binding GntR family transcriptional regulator